MRVTEGTISRVINYVKNGCSLVVGAYGFHELLQSVFQGKYTFVFTPRSLVIVFLSGMIISYVYDWYKLLNMKYVINETQMTLSVKVTDILKQKDGTILIGINNSLEYDLEKIGVNSIHAQLFKKNKREWMEEIFEKEKKKSSRPFDFGYIFTAQSKNKKQEYLFLVMSELNEPQVARSTVASVKKSIKAFLASDKTFNCKNHVLYCPIIGTGETALHISKYEMAKIIANEFVFRKVGECTSVQHLIITIRRADLKFIDLFALNEDIKSIVKYKNLTSGENYDGLS